MITRTIDVNLIPGKEIKHIHLNQRDVISGGLIFRIWNDQTRFTLTSAMTATIEGTKADNKSFQYNATVSPAANTVTANITYQMTAFPGPVETEIRLKSGANDIGVCNFILDIERGGLVDNPDMSNSELPVIFELARKQVEQAAAYANQSKTYRDQSQSYSIQSLGYANQSKTYRDESQTYANKSRDYRDQSENYKDLSLMHAQESYSYVDKAKAWAEKSESYNEISKSWAIGDTGLRDDEDVNNSKYWSKIAESWSVGGTGERDGEANDNSKYWSQISNEYAKKAEEMKDIVSTYTDITIPEFEIDFDTMILYQTNYREASQLKFSLTDSKYLEYEFVA